MKYLFVLIGVMFFVACGVKNDPVPPTAAELISAKPTPTPEPTPSLIKPVQPGYDQNNYDGEGDQ